MHKVPKRLKLSDSDKTAGKNCFEIVKFLIKNGARVSEEDDRGRTPLMLAALNNNQEMIKHLVKLGADVNEYTPRGTVLHFAIKESNIETIRLLTSLGANFNLKEMWTLTPLHLSVQLKRMDVFDLLLELGADILNSYSEYGGTPLTLAAFKDYAQPFEIVHRRGIQFDPASFKPICRENGEVLQFLTSILEQEEKLNLPELKESSAK